MDLHAILANGHGKDGVSGGAISFAVEASHNLAEELTETHAAAVRHAMNDLIGWAKHEAEYALAQRAGEFDRSLDLKTQHSPQEAHHGAHKWPKQTK